MKKKGKKSIIITAIILLFVVVVLIILIKKEQNSITNETYLNESIMEDYNMLREDAELYFKQVIEFCEQNQEEIAIVSIELLSLIKNGDTYDQIISHVDRITSTEWKKLSETLSVQPMSSIPNPMGKIYFFYESIGPFTLEVLYVDETEEDIETYLEMHFEPMDRIQKINENLYVCLTEQQMV
jgi:hypothetical protein